MQLEHDYPDDNGLYQVLMDLERLGYEADLLVVY